MTLGHLVSLDLPFAYDPQVDPFFHSATVPFCAEENLEGWSLEQAFSPDPKLSP